MQDILAALHTRGRDANPGISLSERAFGRYLARCTSDGKGPSPATLPVEDLYFACGCAEKVRGTAALVERRFSRAIRRAVSRVLASPDDRQEAEQRAREHLLVDDAKGAPRIAQYLGQGPLEKWVSVAATRIAISLGRGE